MQWPAVDAGFELQSVKAAPAILLGARIVGANLKLNLSPFLCEVGGFAGKRALKFN